MSGLNGTSVYWFSVLVLLESNTFVFSFVITIHNYQGSSRYFFHIVFFTTIYYVIRFEVQFWKVLFFKFITVQILMLKTLREIIVMGEKMQGMYIYFLTFPYMSNILLNIMKKFMSPNNECYVYCIFCLFL